MRHDLIEEVGGSAGGHGTGNNQAVHIAGGIENAVELLLILRGQRGAGVEDAVFMLTIVYIGADTSDAIDPDRAAQAAILHGLVHDELTGEATEEAEGDGVDAELLERIGNIEALAIGGVAGGAGADVLVGDEGRAGDRHIDSGVCSKGIEHVCLQTKCRPRTRRAPGRGRHRYRTTSRS